MCMICNVEAILQQLHHAQLHNAQMNEENNKTVETFYHALSSTTAVLVSLIIVFFAGRIRSSE